jgi:7-dehydrocholesterol reductase
MSEKQSNTYTNSPLMRLLAPLMLILLCPPFAMLLWHTNIHLNGSYTELIRWIGEVGVLGAIREVWLPVFFGSVMAWKIIGIFAGIQLVLMRVLPGKKYNGPLTPMGNTPEYTDNGLLAYLISLAAFFGLSYGLGLFNAGIVYDHFGEILGAMNISALLFCLFLYFKGRFWPSSTDNGITGNPVFDYYWGTELYPRLLGWDVKMFTNCRFGMIGWSLIVLSFAAAQHERDGFLAPAIAVSAGLQAIYLLKFFLWESGYMRSMDIIVDRAGFYIVWGCLVWVPAFYTTHTLYMVDHGGFFSWGTAIVVLVLGLLAIWINYQADLQRQRVRATDGNCTVWGKKPELIRARYTTDTGEPKESLLLVSGWWGVSRHFHYIPELTVAFLWCLPAGFGSILPYSYFIFLCILLTHRSIRDDKKCAAKYGKYWDEYRKRVPYKIVPGVF